MSVLALIPARSGSRGIPGKNLRHLGRDTLIDLALDCALRAGAHPVITSDLDIPLRTCSQALFGGLTWIDRPPDLAQDDTPMIAVVQHALAQIPGPADQVIVLLQPTQPFRQPTHVQQAIALLGETPGADSVVSVVELPQSHSPDMAFRIDETQRLWPYLYLAFGWPTRRQEARRAYIRDGTVYAFWRKTVTEHNTIYGEHVVPLFIPKDETCELDTPEDWAAVEARWKAQHGQ